MTNNFKKLLSGLCFLTFSTLGFTQNLSTKNINLSANIKPGCFLSAEDFNFGEIVQSNIFESYVTNNINIQCSKNTIISITQRGKTNPAFAGFSYNFLTVNNSGVTTNESYLYYTLKTTLIVSNEKFTLLYKNNNNQLGANSVENKSYAVQLKLLTGENVSLPLVASLNNTGVKHRLLPGFYGDTVSYTMSF